jgi:hypothetical protein
MASTCRLCRCNAAPTQRYTHGMLHQCNAMCYTKERRATNAMLHVRPEAAGSGPTEEELNEDAV